MDKTGNCPQCFVSWKGAPIPEDRREDYNGATHFSRLIAVEDRTTYDGAHSYMCPDCKHIIPRLERGESGYRTTPVIRR